MSAKWPTAVSDATNLYTCVNLLSTTLSVSLGVSSPSTVTVANTSGFPTAGAVTIENEVIFYTGISGNALTGLTRGADGTTAAVHGSGIPVSATLIASHINALNQEVMAIETDLAARLGPGSTSISVPAGVTTGFGDAVTLDSTLRLAKMTSATRDAISTPDAGTMVFNTSTGAVEYYDGTLWSESHGPYVRPEWFGAKGDGVTDDAAAIQAAINHQHALGGGRVQFSGGTYIVGSEVNLNSNIEIAGCPNTVLKLKDSANTTMFFTESKTNILIHDIAFDGNRTNITSGTWPHAFGAIMLLHYCSNVRVNHCRFLNSFYAIGVYGLGANNCVVSENYFTNCDQGVDNYGFGQVISDNNFEAMTGISISIEPTTQAGTNVNEANGNDSSWLVADYSQALETTVHGNTIRGGTYGIVIFDGTVGCSVTGNDIANVSAIGIDAYHSNIKGLVITGNTIRNVTNTNGDGNPWNANGAGIALGSIHGGEVSNNIIEYAWVGIYGASQARLICSENVIQFCATSGICFYSSSGVTITDNVLYNNFLNRSSYSNNSGIILYACTACFLFGNSTIDTNGYQVFCIYAYSTNTGHYLGLNGATGTAVGVVGNFSTATYATNSLVAVVPTASPANFANGLRIGGTRHETGTAAPTSGTWGQGAIVFNATPTELGTAGSKYLLTGWMCVSTGTPGTWLPMHCLTGN